MSTRTSSQDAYLNVVHESCVDAGLSGQLHIVAATGAAGPLVFVDSDALGQRRLVLTLEQAKDVGHALFSIAFRTEHLLSAAGPTL